ncbi:MAG: MFS transporter, partial [Limisphaerales bacterium]
GKAGLGLHYRWVFLIFGVLGVVWAVCFFNWFRDRPKDHPAVNAAELAHIGDHSHTMGDHSVPWRKLLHSRTVWMLWGQYFCMSYAWYFYITWMPTYLKEKFADLTDMNRALLACVPLFFGGLGSLFAGFISAPLEKWLGNTARTRRFFGVAGLASAGVMLVISIQFTNPLLSVLAVGLASFCNDLAMPGAWGACMDVGGKHTGSLSGSMNMMGNAGGALAPLVIPYVLKWTDNNWNVNFWMFAAVYFIGSVCWMFIDPVTPLEREGELTPAAG